MLSEAGLVLTRDMGGPKVTPYIDLACQRDEEHRATVSQGTWASLLL